MANEVEIIVNKRSIRAIDTTTKEEFFSTFIDQFKWRRDINDNFTFYNSSETVNSYGDEALNRLGVNQDELGVQTGIGSFVYTNTLNPDTGVKFVSADVMDAWLGTNTGFFFNPNLNNTPHYISGITTGTLIKSTAGYLGRVIFSRSGGASTLATILLYDDTTATNQVGRIEIDKDDTIVIDYDFVFSTGLFVVISGSGTLGTTITFS